MTDLFWFLRDKLGTALRGRKKTSVRQQYLNSYKAGVLSDRLEERIMLAGQLPVQIVGGADPHVLVNAGTDREIEVRGETVAAQSDVETFFSSADGATSELTTRAQITAGGEEVAGEFTFAEFTSVSGVSVIAADATVRLGDTVGVQLSDADGVFALLTSGFAGQLHVSDSGDTSDIEVFGLAGLALDSAQGLTFSLNTAGVAVHETVSTAGGDVAISLEPHVEKIEGVAAFRVSSAVGPIAEVDGLFTFSEGTTVDSQVQVSAQNVRATVSVADVRAASLASQQAQFTLGVDVDPVTGAETAAFRLIPSSFVVGGFLLLPGGTTNTVDPSNGGAGGRAVLNKASLGPLELSFVSMALPTFELIGDEFAIEAGIDASFHPNGKATLSFKEGGGSSHSDAIKFEAAKPKGSIEIRGIVDDVTGVIDTALLPGTFTLAASSITLNLPELLEAKASGSPTFTFDPTQGFDQQIFTTNRLDVKVLPLNVTGEFLQTANNPALVVRGDGFAFGRGTVTLNENNIRIGSLITIANPFVRLTDFEFGFDTGFSLGQFAIGAARVRVAQPGNESLWSVAGDGVTAAVTFGDDFGIDEVKFTVNALTGTLGTHFRFSTTNTTFRPTATGDEEVLRVAGAVSAGINAGPLDLSGSMSRFSIQADGDFTPLENFQVSLGLGVTKASQLLWPEFIPLQIDNVGLRWPNFEKDPGNFQLLFSGGVNGTLPLNVASLTGTVKGLIVDIDKLISGEFPIVAVEEVAIAARGEILGGSISGGLFIGVIKLDAEGNRLPDGAATFDDTVLYAGIQGGFDFPNLGQTDIRIAVSEFGPMNAYFSAGVPIPIDPVFTGIAVTQLRGGITFNATPIQPPSSPADLVGSAFKPQTSLTFEQWKERSIQQVANLATGGSGFIFDHGDDVGSTISDLNNGGVSQGKSFEKAFQDRGFPIGNAFKRPSVTAIDFGKKWQISVGDQHYIVEKKGELGGTKLRVSAVNFTVEQSMADSLVDGGFVPSSLVAKFASHRLKLDTGYRVEVTKTEPSTGQPTKWTLSKATSSGDRREYFVQRHTGDGGVLSVTGAGGVFEDLGLGDYRVEFGATVFSTHITETAFTADVDMTMTSDAKYVLSGNFKFGSKFSADTRAFIDFGVSDPEQGLAPRIVMLADFPGQSSGLPRVARLQGDVFFEFRDENGEIVKANTRGIEDIRSFTLRFLGRGELTALDLAKVVIGGDAGGKGEFAELAATFSVDPDAVRFQLDVAGSIGIEGIIPADDLATGAGQLVFEVPLDGESPELYGGLKLDFDTSSGGLSFLEDAGLKADAEVALVLNATNTIQQIDLALPGRDIETFFLEALTLGFELQGSLILGQSIAGFGAQLVFDGVFSATVRVDENDPTDTFDDTVDFELFMAALLEVDAQAVGQNLNLLTLDAMGVFVARDVGPFNLIPDLAGRVDLVGAAGIPGVLDITSGTAPATLEFNTTGQDQTYVVPERLRDRLAVIQGRRENKDPGDVVIPPTTIQGGDTIVITGTPPALLTGQALAAGPYFMVNFGGDVDDETDDAGITFLNAYKLTGDFRVVAAATGGLELLVNARAGVDLPGLENLIQTTATTQGLFRISQAGIVGALTVDGNLDLGGLIEIDADIFLGINTTKTDEAVSLTAVDGGRSTRVLQSESAEVLVEGDASIGGLQLDGEFRIFSQGGEMQFSIDAGIDFFDIAGLRIQETATIETGSGVGLTLNSPLNTGTRFDFGQPGIFEASGELRLILDTVNNVAEIRVDDLELEAFEAIELSGSGRVAAFTDAVTGEQFLRLYGNLEGEFFDLVQFDVDGFYDSRGYVDLTLRGRVELGGSSFGVRGSGEFRILRDESIPLDISGSGEVRVRAFGQSIAGVDLDVDYNGGTGRITVSAQFQIRVEVDLGLFGFGFDVVDEEFGPYTVGFIGVGALTDPRLGVKDGNGGLILNVGDRANQRNLEPTINDEAYIIQSLGPGTERGQKIMVRGFGSRQIFDDITSISGDFGIGNDEVRIDESLGEFTPITISLNGGADQDRMTNESSLSATFSGGEGDDILVGADADDIFRGDGGNDELIGGLGDDRLEGGAGDDMLIGDAGRDTLLGQAGNDILVGGLDEDIVRGGANNDRNIWSVGDGDDTEFAGNGGIDRLVVNGTLVGETYTISTGAMTTVTIQGGEISTVDMDAEEIGINASGGADVVTITAANADALTGVFVSLGAFDGGVDENGDVIEVDDGVRDSITLQSGDASDVFEIDVVAGNTIRVVRGGFTLGVSDTTPNEDDLLINGSGGNDRFTVAGPGNESAGALLNLELLGGAGDDSFQLPIGTVKFDGQADTDDATFTTEPGDTGFVSLNALTIGQNVIGGPQATTVYGDRVEAVSVEAAHALNLSIRSTIAGATTVTAPHGGNINVFTTAGPLSIDGGGSDLDVELGFGNRKLAPIRGDVHVADSRNLAFLNTNDSVDRQVVLDDSQLTGIGDFRSFTHTGVQTFELSLGRGNDSTDVSITTSNVSVDGGSGQNDLRAVTSGAPGQISFADPARPLLDVTSYRSVVLRNEANLAASDWLLDSNQLSAEGRDYLAAPVDAVLDLTLGEGDGDQLQILRVDAKTTIALRGQSNTVTVGGLIDLGLAGAIDVTLDDLDANVLLTGDGGAGNSLLLDDTRTVNLSDALRTRVFDGSTVSGDGADGVLTYSPVAYGNVESRFGGAFDDVRLVDAGLVTLLETGTGDDMVHATGVVGTLVVRGEDGTDALTVAAGPMPQSAGSIRFEGGDGVDELRADRSESLANLTGSLSVPDEATLSVDGLPTLVLPEPIDVEQVTAWLGAGNDRFVIDNPNATIGFDLLAGDGDDVVEVQALSGDVGSHRVNTQGGRDEVRVTVSGQPVADQFTQLAASAEVLVVDNTAFSGDVDWLMSATVLSADGVDVIDTDGADLLRLLAGTGTNSLEVSSGGSVNPIEAIINGERVEIREGANVLSFVQSLNSFEVNGVIDGLSGARVVASSPDGQFTFAGGQDEGLLVFRKVADTLQVVGTYRHEEIHDPTAIAVSDDGNHLYVGAANASGDHKLVVLAIEFEGRLSHQQSFDFASPITDLDVSADGLGVAAIETITGTVTVVPGGPQELVGIDIDFDEFQPSPTNWTGFYEDPVAFEHPETATFDNLFDESGAQTEVDLVFASSADDGNFADVVTFAPSQLPSHTQSLAGLDTYIAAYGGPASFTFSDLDPLSMFEVYAFAASEFENEQTVTIQGLGAPLVIQQDLPENQLYVNREPGTDARSLASYAELVRPAVGGTISIQFEAVSQFGFSAIASIAIREITVDEPPSSDTALTTFLRDEQTGNLAVATFFNEEVSGDLTAGELTNAVDVRFTQDGEYIIVATDEGLQTFERNSSGDAYEWVSQFADNPNGTPIGAASSMHVSDDGNLLFALQHPFSNSDEVTLNYYHLTPELDGLPARLAGTITGVSRFSSLRERSGNDLFEYDDETGVLTVLEFEGKIATYSLQPDGTFTFVDRYEFPEAGNSNVKEAPVDLAFSKVFNGARVMAVPTRTLNVGDFGSGIRDIHFFTVTPDGDILDPHAIASAPAGDQFAGHISWVEFDGPATMKGRFVAVEGDQWTDAENQSGAEGRLENVRFAFFDAAGQRDSNVSNTVEVPFNFGSDGGVIGDIEVSPARSDVFWMTFHDVGDRLSILRAYHLNGSTAQGVIVHNTEGGLPEVGVLRDDDLSGAIDIEFLPDGTGGYLTDLFSGHSHRLNLSDASLNSLINIRANGSMTAPIDLNSENGAGGSVTIGNDRLYLSQSFSLGTNTFLTVEPLPASAPAVPGSQVALQSGDNAFSIADTTHVEFSADGSLAYFATANNEVVIVAVAPNDHLERVSSGRVVGVLAGNGSNGLSDITELTRFGTQLFVASAGEDSIAVFDLNPTTGLPTFSAIVRDSSDGDRRLEDLNALAVTAGGISATSAVENSLTFVPLDAGSVSTPSKYEEGDPFQRALVGFDAVASHPTLPILYGVSSIDNALYAINTDTDAEQSFVDGTAIQSLESIRDVAVSPSGKFVVTVSPVDNAVTVFEQLASGMLEFRSTIASIGAMRVEFFNDQELLVIGDDKLKPFSVAADGALSLLTTLDVPGASSITVDGTQLLIGSETTGTLTVLSRVAPMLGGSGFFDENERLFQQGPTGNAPDNRDLAFGDVDGDGDVDLFIVHDDTANRLWLNQGGLQGGVLGTYEDSGQLLGNFRSDGIALGDLDGDGDLDAFIANRGRVIVDDDPEPNTVFINQGGAQGGTLGEFLDSGQRLGNSRSTDVALGDLDGDGDLDAFVTNEGANGASDGEPNMIWINQGGTQGGNEGEFLANGQSLGLTRTRAVELADVDGDGDLDAVTVNEDGFDISNSGPIDTAARVWVNQGGGQGGTAGAFVDSGQRLGVSESFYGLTLGDVDNDGDVDAFLAGFTPQLFINQGFEQLGSQGIFADSGQSFGPGNAVDAAFADVDGDGDIDLYLTRLGFSGDQGDQVFINSGGVQIGTPGVFTDSGQRLGQSFSAAVSFADIDLDGDIDFATAIGFSGTRTYENLDRTGSFVESDAVENVGRIRDVAVHQSNAYAINDSGNVVVLTKSGVSGDFTLRQTVIEGENGVRGIDDASAVAVSEDGRFVFVAGRASDSIAAFVRNATSGELTFAQLIRDGRSGVSGLGQPTAFAVDGNQLVVGTTAARGAARGGFVVFDITEDPVPVPLNVTTEFESVSGLTVTTGPDNDRIRLLAAPDRTQVLQATINAGPGEDLVNVLDASPMMSIDLGEGDDRLNLNLSASTNGTISGGIGIDVVSVDRIGEMSQWTVAVDDNDFGDVVVVSGGGIPTTSTLNLTGDVRAVGQSPFDTIVYDGDPVGVTVTDDGSQIAGAITQPGSGEVTYAGFNNQPADPQQIFVKVAPRPVINSIPGSIAEGDGVVLQAIDQSGAGGTLTYEWDLDRDGDFGDAVGDAISLSWQDLKFFGIADDGTFNVSVRITRTTDAIPQLPAFEVSAVGTTPLVVTNTSPDISVLGGTSVELFDVFPITFSHSVDPGNDRVTGWEVDWGDGTVEQFGSAATGGAHAFETLGPQTITVTANDEDGRHSQTISVDVIPGASLLSLGLVADIREGDDLELTGTVAGSPSTAGYYVRVNGQATETYFPAANASAPTADIAWNAIEQLSGIDGSDTLIVQLAATFGGPEFRTAETAVVIANVAPDGVVMPSHTSIAEGAANPVTVTVANLLDPSNVDTVAGFVVSYDFGDDGAFDVVNVDPAIATPIPAPHFASSGELVVRARVFDDTGFRDLFATIDVNDVAPVVTVVTQSGTVNEGDALVLDVTVADPGGDEILEWVISWGDGTETTGSGPIPQQMHTYSDGLPTGTVRTIQVAVTTEEAIGIGTAQVTVRDVAPMVTLSSLNTSVAEGSIENAFELDMAMSDPGDDVVTSITIDWGDGNVETVAGAPSSVRHVYAEVGTYTVSLTELSSADGVFAHPSNSVVVSVADVVPQIVLDELDIPRTAREAEQVDLQVLAVGSESGDDALAITWVVTDPSGAPVAVEQSSTPVRRADIAFPRAEIGFRSLAHFVPVDDGKYAILLTIEDDDGNTVKHSATITVANRTPVIDLIDVPGTIIEGESVVLNAAATDPAEGADPLTYTWIATNSLTGVRTSLYGSSVNWTPTGGRYGIDLVVEDDETGRATRSAALDVVATQPEITSLSVPAAANESDTVTFSATAIDAASVFDDLAFTWRVRRPDGTVESIGGDVVSYRFADDGDYVVTLVVIDPNGTTATSDPQIVDVGNLDPEITTASIPNIGVEGDPVEFTATATDAAATRDPLNVQWVISHPDGSTTRLGGNLVSFTPNQDGVYTVRLTVDDSDGGEVTRTADLVVANRVPAIDSVMIPSFAIAGLPERLSVEVTDSPGDLQTLVVEWRLTNTVTGEELVLSGATVDFVPAEGVYEVEMTVSDGEAAPVQRTATMPVGSVVIDPDRVEGEPVGLKVTNRYLGASALTYAWRVDGPNNFVKRRLGRSVVFTPVEDGEFLATLSVTDGARTVELVVPFDVGNARPVSQLSGPERVFQSEEVEFVIGAPADPGTDTVTEFVVDWGDGTQTTVTHPGPVGHTYSEAIGETDVTLTLLDEDGVHENVTTKTISVEDYPTIAFADQSYAVTESGVSTGASLELVRFGNLSVGSTVRLRLSGVEATPRSRSTAASDFDDTVLTVVFEPNVATQVVSVPIINDTISELDESFTVSIVPVENAKIGDNAGTVVSIEDDDIATLTISDASLVEGDEGKTAAVVQITLNGTIDSPVRVLLETKDLTATAASGDYQAKSEELRFSGHANETKTFTVGVFGDTLFELDELFAVEIVAVNSEQREVSLPTRRSHVEITNDDEAPLPVIESIEGTFIEGNPITINTSVDEVSGPAMLALEIYRASSLYAKRPPQSDGLFRFTPNDDGPYDIVLTAIDGLGNSQSVSQSILIENAEPAIIADSLELRLDQKRVSLTGSFTDPGRRDSHRVTIDWGDGNEEEFLIETSKTTIALEHTYQHAGQYSVSITVTDDDGATSQQVELAAFSQGVDLVAGDLWIVGSSGRDRVDISEKDGIVRVFATFSGESRRRFEFPFAATNAIRIHGLDGNDRLHIEHDLPIAATVYGGAGDDSIRTGSGNDYIDGGTGRDWIRGRDGNDEIVDLIGPASVRGGDGNDKITTGASDDWIAGGDGNDIVVAGDGRNVVDGGRGNDHIMTGSGDDRIRGRDGDDVIEARDGDNRVVAGDGDDIVITGSGNDFVRLGDGNDVVSAGAGNDWLHGGKGHDLLIGGYGSDIGWGGRDRDLLIGESVENETDVSALSDARDDWLDDNIEAALQDLAAYTDDEDRGWLRGGRHRDEILEGPNDRLTF